MSYNQYGGAYSSPPSPYTGLSAQPSLSTADSNYKRDCETIYNQMLKEYNELQTLQSRLLTTAHRGQDDKLISSGLVDNTKETAKKIDKILDLLKEELQSYKKKLDNAQSDPKQLPLPTKTTTTTTTTTPTPIIPASSSTYPPPTYGQYHPPQQQPGVPLHPPQQYNQSQPIVNRPTSYPPPQTTTTTTSTPAPGPYIEAPAHTHQSSYPPPQQPQPTAQGGFNTGAFGSAPAPQPQYPPGHQPTPPQQGYQSQYSKPTHTTTKSKKNGKSSSSSSSEGFNKAFHKFSKDLGAAFSGKKDKKDKKDKHKDKQKDTTKGEWY